MAATPEMVAWFEGEHDPPLEDALAVSRAFRKRFPDAWIADMQEAARIVQRRQKGDQPPLPRGPAPVYPTSQIKRRRETKQGVEARREAILRLAIHLAPATVRQVFYQATVRGLVDKSEAGYGKVQNDLVLLRRSGALPYDALADNTRWQRRPRTYTNVESALRSAAKFYRKDLWAEADCYVEIWLEKDALAGVIMPVTTAYDTPLMVARGYASLSFLHTAAEDIAALNVPAYIYHLGDFDPSGVNAGEKIEQTLREMAPSAEIHFERVAVTPRQIETWSLPTRPTKTTDSRARNFGDVSVELDAIEPGHLRALVESAIRRHMPADYYNELMLAQESERSNLETVVDHVVAEGWV